MRALSVSCSFGDHLNQILREHTDEPLRAAGDAMDERRQPGRERVGELVAVAVDPPEIGAGRHHVRARTELERTRPLHHRSERRWSALVFSSDRLLWLRGGVAAGTANVFWKKSSLSKNRRASTLLPSANLQARAAVAELPVRVVDLADLAVVALLVEDAPADEQVHAIGRVVVDFRADVLILDVRFVVDRSALFFGHDLVAIGLQRSSHRR